VQSHGQRRVGAMTVKRILVALDGSDHASRALDLACALASRFGAELIAMHAVCDRPLSAAERSLAQVEFHTEIVRDFDATPFVEARGDPQLMSQRLTAQAVETGRRFRVALGERLVQDAASRAGAQATSVRTVLREGDPATAILEVAKAEQIDMIVMGRRGLGDLAGLLLGSVSHKVGHLADCACLTVR
jgi:nucleotide-binding universal stress UspA family protein